MDRNRNRSLLSLVSNKSDKSETSYRTSEEEFRSRSHESGKTYLDPKTGTVVTQREVVEKRTASGLCISCGTVQTHKKKYGGYKMVPLNVEGTVSKGVCLKCFPESLEDVHNEASIVSKGSGSGKSYTARENEMKEYVPVKNITNIIKFLKKNEDGDLALAAIAEAANLTPEEYKNSTHNELNLLFYHISNSSLFIKDTIRQREEICKLIWKLSFYGDDIRKKELFQLGCGSSILRFLNGNHVDDEVFRRSCRALSSLVEEEGNRKTVLNKKILHHLDSTAKNNMISSATIVEVLKAMTALFSIPCTISKEDAKSASNAAKYAMKHKKSYDVHRSGLELLHAISMNFKEIDDFYVVGPLIFSTLTFHNSDISLKRKGIQLFINHVEETGYFYLQPDIMDDIYVFLNNQMVLNNMDQSPEHLELLEEIFVFYGLLLSHEILDPLDIATTQLVYNMIAVITSCYKTNAMRPLYSGLKILSLCPQDAISSSDSHILFKVIEKVMMNEKSDLTMLCESMQLLQILILDEDTAAMIQKTTIVDMIIDAIHGNKENSKIADSALHAIQPMSIMSKCRIDLEEKKVFDVVLMIISSSNNESTIATGMGILSNLSIHPENLEATLISSKNTKSVLNIMKNYPDNSSIQSNGCTLFRNALLKDENKSTLHALGEGLVDILLLASEKHPSSCRENVTTVCQVVFAKKEND